MGLHTPRMWKQIVLQSEPSKIGLSSSRHIPGKLMTVESHYTCLTGASKLCARLVMQSFHFLVHFFRCLVVSLPLVQIVWQGSIILVFIRMWSPYPPNWSPISIYNPLPVLLPAYEFDPLFPFVTIHCCAFHATLLRCHALACFDTATDCVLFLSAPFYDTSVISSSDHRKTVLYQRSAYCCEGDRNSDIIRMLQKYQAIHYCNQSVLVIVPDLNIFVFIIMIVDLIFRSALVRFSLLCARYLYNSTGLRLYILCSEPISHLCNRHCRGWVHYIETLKKLF